MLRFRERSGAELDSLWSRGCAGSAASALCSNQAVPGRLFARERTIQRRAEAGGSAGGAARDARTARPTSGSR
eukprot:7796643-Alexandrium_andersonii.AAC.1